MNNCQIYLKKGNKPLADLALVKLNVWYLYASNRCTPTFWVLQLLDTLHFVPAKLILEPFKTLTKSQIFKAFPLPYLKTGNVL